MAHQKITEPHLAKVKGPVLVPLAIAFCVILIAFFTVVWVWSGNQQQRELVDSSYRFDDLLYQSMEDQGQLLIQNQDWVKNSLDDVYNASPKEIEQVLNLALNLSRKALNVNRISYISMDQEVLSSASDSLLNQDFFGDDSVSQFAFSHLAPSVGSILLPNGELLIRSVTPLYFEGEPQGFLLMDKSLDNVITSIARSQNIYVSIVVPQDKVDMKSLSLNSNLLGSLDKVDTLDGYISINNSDALLDQSAFNDVLKTYAAHELATEIFFQPDVDISDKKYDLSIVPLLSSDGASVAKLILAKDVTRTKQELNLANLITGMVAIFVALLLFSFFYFLLGKIEKSIQLGERRLVSARDEAESHRQAAEQSKLDVEKSRDLAEVARASAEQASQVKSEFLAKMSHELRTPLNAIIGLSEMMNEDAIEFEDDDYIEPSGRVLRAAKHLLRLINDILDISKIEAGKMELHNEVFDLELLVQDVVSTIKPLTDQKNLQLQCDSDPIHHIFTDQTRLKQILLNLMSNATKFTNEGSVLLSVSRKANNIRFAIKDSGIGMTDDEAASLFQEFVQLDSANNRKHDGTGLGLAISRKFARMMGGDIRVTSVKGEGSEFILELPFNSGDETADDAVSDLTFTKVEKVLVVDDDEIGRALLKRHLEQSGYEVLCAVDGIEALEVARSQSPDLILLDLEMPRLNGWDTLAALKADVNLKDIPVVIVSLDDDKNRGFALGAKEFLTKPVDGGDLEFAIDRLQKQIQKEHCEVLIIDDSEDTRELIKRSLAKLNWHVREAVDGITGLQEVEKQRPDIIMLDLMMPVMDGFEFLEKFAANPDWEGIPVVVMTAMSLTSKDRLLLDTNVASIIEKGDFNRQKLIKTISKLIQ